MNGKHRRAAAKEVARAGKQLKRVKEKEQQIAFMMEVLDLLGCTSMEDAIYELKDLVARKKSDLKRLAPMESL